MLLFSLMDMRSLHFIPACSIMAAMSSSYQASGSRPLSVMAAPRADRSMFM